MTVTFGLNCIKCANGFLKAYQRLRQNAEYLKAYAKSCRQLKNRKKLLIFHPILEVVRDGVSKSLSKISVAAVKKP